jgi:hypothetical protein
LAIESVCLGNQWATKALSPPFVFLRSLLAVKSNLWCGLPGCTEQAVSLHRYPGIDNYQLLARRGPLAYISPMLFRVFIFCVAGLLAGCSNPKFLEDQSADENLFAASAMRIHPIFTQIKDWTGDGVPDGIETLVEFQDPFGDPTKAAGVVRFELYTYRQGDPDPRGQRVTNPWAGSLSTSEDQRARWNRTSRTYSFQLAYSQIQAARTYVLEATFRPTGSGPRLFARIVLPGQENKGESAARPTTQGGVVPRP